MNEEKSRGPIRLKSGGVSTAWPSGGGNEKKYPSAPGGR